MYLWGGAGGWAASGGRSKSLKSEQQKTVGPSFAKNRKFEGPPVIRDPDNNESVLQRETENADVKRFSAVFPLRGWSFYKVGVSSQNAMKNGVFSG